MKKMLYKSTRYVQRSFSSAVCGCMCAESCSLLCRGGDMFSFTAENARSMEVERMSS